MKKIITGVFLKNLKYVKDGPKVQRYAIGHGLNFVVNQSGGKRWEYRFRFEGKWQTLSLGVYDLVGLAEARKKHAAARKELEAGLNPAAEKQATKAALKAAQEAETQTFEKAAVDYYQTRQGVYSEKSNLDLLGRLRKHIFPALGTKPIWEISAPELLNVLTKIKATGREEMAARLRQYCGQVFKFAMRQG